MKNQTLKRYCGAIIMLLIVWGPIWLLPYLSKRPAHGSWVIVAICWSLAVIYLVVTTDLAARQEAKRQPAPPATVDLEAQRKREEKLRLQCREVFAQGPIGRWKCTRFSPADRAEEWRIYPDGRIIVILDVDADMYPSYRGGPYWMEYQWRQTSANSIELRFIGDNDDEPGLEPDREPDPWEPLRYDFRAFAESTGRLIWLWPSEGSADSEGYLPANRLEVYLCDINDPDEAPKGMRELPDLRPLEYVGPPDLNDGSPDSIIEEILG